MKVTATLEDIVRSELLKQGKSELVDNVHINIFNDKFSVIHKMMIYDDDVKNIINNKIFRGMRLEDENSDNKFKKTFVNRFIIREIGQQTMESFSSQLIYTFLKNKDFLNRYYKSLDDYLDSKAQSETSDNDTRTSDNRFIESTLPQDEINLSLNDDDLNFADRNTISKDKVIGNKTGTQKQTQKSLENLVQLKTILDDVFNEIDKNCFLQIW